MRKFSPLLSQFDDTLRTGLTKNLKSVQFLLTSGVEYSDDFRYYYCWLMFSFWFLADRAVRQYDWHRILSVTLCIVSLSAV